MSIESVLDRERAEIAALFEEDVELGLYDLAREATFRVTSVNGNPPQHRILVMYYDNEIYLNPEDRSNTNRLTVSDLDFCVRYGQVGNIANIEMRVQHPSKDVVRYGPDMTIPSGTKVSLLDLLTRAYQLGGYGERHELLNSDEITEEQARMAATEALGLPDRESGDDEIVFAVTAMPHTLCMQGDRVEDVTENCSPDEYGHDFASLADAVEFAAAEARGTPAVLHTQIHGYGSPIGSIEHMVFEVTAFRRNDDGDFAVMCDSDGVESDEPVFILDALDLSPELRDAFDKAAASKCRYLDYQSEGHLTAADFLEAVDGYPDDLDGAKTVPGVVTVVPVFAGGRDCSFERIAHDDGLDLDAEGSEAREASSALSGGARRTLDSPSCEPALK